ncbi:MAG: ribosomal-protein-alanine N-acetyltransferase [Thermoprotei archaeon]|nr:MAG: ribosomal-protein-alanine N-acetyltransferase [Thermoprotei archaeon]
MENTEEYYIREFRPDDLDEVIRINKSNLPENYPSYFFKLHHERYPKAFLVAMIKDKIVGYVMCRVEEGILYTAEKSGRQGHIVSLAVDKPFRRRGIGKALMKKAMKALYNDYKVDEYYLEVRVSNGSAISLYEKLGYKKVKVIKGYYLDGEDAYLMARPAPYSDEQI